MVDCPQGDSKGARELVDAASGGCSHDHGSEEPLLGEGEVGPCAPYVHMCLMDVPPPPPFVWRGTHTPLSYKLTHSLPPPPPVLHIEGLPSPLEA